MFKLRPIVVCLLVGLGACGGNDTTTPVSPTDASVTKDAAIDTSDSLFGRSMVDVDITMVDSAWEDLRNQFRAFHKTFGGVDCHNSPVEHDYSYLPGTMTVDGEDVGKVALRKKGFVGSQTNLKPSIKVQFNRFEPEKRFESMQRITLNNVRSDPSHMRTCLAYHLFERAGIPASRCTFAQVSVNGEAMGVYALVEEVKPDYIARHFDSTEGNLYEASINDFRPGFLGFEKETNKSSDGDRSDLNAVVDVLENAPDDELAEQLNAQINLEQFYRYWATEVLMWQRGGYSGNANNYFVYASPGDQGRLHFIPWGPDNVMKENTFAGAPDSVLASGVLSSRLYALPDTRAVYYQTLDTMIEEVWDENHIKEWIDEHGAIIREVLESDKLAAFDDDVLFLKTFVDERKQVLADARQGGDPEWINGLYPSLCRPKLGSLRATIQSRWDTLDESYFTSGTVVNASLNIDGTTISTLTQSGARVGLQDTTSRDRLQFLFETEDLRRFTFSINLPASDRFRPVTSLGEHPLFFPAFSANGTEVDVSSTPTRVLRSLSLGDGQWTTLTFEKELDGTIEVEVRADLFERL